MPQTQIDPVDGDLSLSVGKPHNLNVTLSAEHYEKLKRLARAKGLSQAVLVRQSIEYRYQMECQQFPLCANGGRCYIPNAHPPAQAAPHQNLLPEEKPI